MTGPPLNDAVPTGSQAGIAAITRGLSKAREDKFDINRSMHVLAAQIRALRAEAKRVAELEGLLREAIPGLKNYGQGSDTYDLVFRIKAALP